MNTEATILAAAILGLTFAGLLWIADAVPSYLAGLDFNPQLSQPDFSAKWLDDDGREINR